MNRTDRHTNKCITSHIRGGNKKQ